MAITVALSLEREMSRATKQQVKSKVETRHRNFSRGLCCPVPGSAYRLQPPKNFAFPRTAGFQ